MIKHKFHNVIIQWANGAAIEVYQDGEWHETSKPNWLSKNYRVKEYKTLIIQGSDNIIRSYLEGLTTYPTTGTAIYIADPLSGALCKCETWVSSVEQEIAFVRGLVHNNFNDAVNHCRAMIGIACSCA